MFILPADESFLNDLYFLLDNFLYCLNALYSHLLVINIVYKAIYVLKT